MKKTGFVLFAVLLVLLMANCDFLTPPLDTEEDLPLFTEDGRPMAHLTIGVGNDGTGRALTVDLAKSLVDYYEVAFKDPNHNGTTNTKIYRTSWNYAKTGRIAVPAGDYTGPEEAILFAGRYNDKTLYAAGIITGIDGSPTSTPDYYAVITPTTTKVTFTLSPLLNDINGDSTSSTSSTFLITGPTSVTIDGSTHSYASASLSGGKIPMATLTGGKKYPVFALPAAGFTNGGTPSTTNSIMASWKVTCGSTPNAVPKPYFDGVMIAPGAKIVSAGYSDDVTTDLGVKVDGSVTAPAANTKVTGEFTLLIDISGNTKNGLSRLSIDVPVCPINTTDNDPGTWYIRGGMNQSVLDEGKGAEAPIGGAVLLGVGPVSAWGIDIEVK